VLGVSQITSLALFPVVSKRLTRGRIYLIAMLLVVSGYIVFFFAPTTTMVFIGIAGVLIFIGQAAIQLLILLFLADTVDYGHWKLGKRNDSVTFSLQPFVYKAGGAVATGIVGFTAIIVGINNNPAALLDGANLFTFKSMMFLLPLACILAGWAVYKLKFRIDEEFYATIHSELVSRGELVDTSEAGS
jgi:melibiose permease/lactose/raffinose/galactose permease